MTLKVLQDNKEKTPWDLSIYGFDQERVHLATGDYTIEGYEDIICIERKRTPAEVAGNLGVERKRFEAELVRMEEFRFRCIICEFTAAQLGAFPKGAKIPSYLKRKIRIRGPYLIKKLNEICEEHGIELIFAGNKQRAEEEAVEFLQRAHGVLSGEIEHQN